MPPSISGLMSKKQASAVKTDGKQSSIKETITAQENVQQSSASAATGNKINKSLPAKLSMDIEFTKEQLKEIFNQFDDNASGRLSLAEIDKSLSIYYPDSVGRQKKAMMEAYKAADVSGDGFIGRKEFGMLLYSLAYFDELQQVFNAGDINKEGRVSIDSFKQHIVPLLVKNGVAQSIQKSSGIDLKDSAQMEQFFRALDGDSSGYLRFGEFCIEIAKLKIDSLFTESKMSLKDFAVLVNDQVDLLQTASSKKEDVSTSAKLSQASAVQPDVVDTDDEVTAKVDGLQIDADQQASDEEHAIQDQYQQETLDRLPKQLSIGMKLTPEALRETFNRFDNNGSGQLSLAEIDKAMVELFPNSYGKHKKAVMRAYKSADASGNGYVEIEEFSMLLYFLAYYSDLYEVYIQGDPQKSGRIDFESFKSKIVPVLKKNGVNTELKINLSDAKAVKSLFDKFDVDQGGYVRFEEFAEQMARLNVDKLFVKKTTKKSQESNSKQQQEKKASNVSQNGPISAKRSSPQKAIPNQKSQTTPKSSSTSSKTAVTSNEHSASAPNDRKYKQLQIENQRLLLQVQIQSEQIAKFGGKVDSLKADKALAQFDSLTSQIAQLQDKLDVEGTRYRDIHKQLMDAKSIISKLQVQTQKDANSLVKSSAVPAAAAVSTQKELKMAKDEAARFEKMYMDTCRKMEETELKCRKLSEENALLKREKMGGKFKA
ncbi:hypothetical protein MIR68_008798 [Amoeboaphelidium protococcarum]|nr:hypothetical protein MIR68_008798 [Amoeboaphelidium protococcarum]